MKSRTSAQDGSAVHEMQGTGTAESVDTLCVMPDADDSISVGTQSGSHHETAKKLTKSTLALHLNTISTSVFGFAFLIVAARLYNPDEVGRNMALVSAMALLAAVAELNAGMALLRFLPRLGTRSSAIVLRVLAVTVSFACLLAIGFVFIAPMVSGELEYIDDNPLLAIAFVLAIMCWTAYLIGDVLLSAVRASGWVPVKNTIFGVFKLVVMVALFYTSIDNGIFLGWAAAAVALTLPSLVMTFRGPLRRHEIQSEQNPAAPDDLDSVLRTKRGVARYLSYDYIAAVMSQVGTSLLPIVVIATLGSESAAEFAVAFAIITAIEQFALNAGIVLTVEGAFDTSAFSHLVRHSFLRFGALLLAIVVIGLLGAPIATALYGGDYGSETTNILRMLLLGLIPESIVILYQSVARIQARTERIAIINAVQAVVTVGLAAVLSDPFGLTGVGIAWIVGHGITAIAVFPSLIRMMFPRTPAAIAN